MILQFDGKSEWISWDRYPCTQIPSRALSCLPCSDLVWHPLTCVCVCGIRNKQTKERKKQQKNCRRERRRRRWRWKGTWQHGDRARASAEWKPRGGWWEEHLLRPHGGESSWGQRCSQWPFLLPCTPFRTFLLQPFQASRMPLSPTVLLLLSPFLFVSSLTQFKSISIQTIQNPFPHFRIYIMNNNKFQIINLVVVQRTLVFLKFKSRSPSPSPQHQIRNINIFIFFLFFPQNIFIHILGYCKCHILNILCIKLLS